MKRSRGVITLACAIGALNACAPAYSPQFLDAMAAGSRAYHAGRYLEAAGFYDRAAKDAARVKDRDEALFLEARTFERAERFADAKKTYERIIATSKDGPRTIRAEFDIAELEIAHGDVERGYGLLDAAMRKHTEHGLARPALRRLAERAGEQGGYAGELSYLRARQAELEPTELDQTLAYEIAMTLDRSGNAQAAHDAFVATAKKHPYPKGGLTDDAWFRAAKIDEDKGRFDEALDHLTTLLANRETADTMGSYERPRYSPAQQEIALIYRDHLKDHKKARAAFHALYATHPTSILRDDALWEEAKLAKQDGDASDACSLVDLLARSFPDSRYAPCGALLCEHPAPTKPETAKRACADYLARDFGSGN
jgi:tetratricopeptide (TPR) repeat protein